MSKIIRDILNFKKNWIELSEIALSDEKITMEEYLLILNFTENVERYVELMEESLQDGVLSKDDRVKLFQLRSRMMQEAIEVAQDDRMITPDEFALLRAISELLELVEKVEKIIGN